MTALTGDRNTKNRLAKYRRLPVAAGVKIYNGAMVALDSSGYARPARASTTDRIVGISRGTDDLELDRADNTDGSAGDIYVNVECEGLHCLKNSASTDAIALTDIGYSCYAADDNVVALTSAAGTRVRAGRIHDVDDDGVWVDFMHRPNIVPVKGAQLADVSANSTSGAVLSPVAGRCVGFVTQLGGPITVADANVTPKIGGVAMTGGALVVAFTGSAANDMDQSSPHAANTVAVGSALTFSSDGGSTDTATLDGTFLIEVP